ncbi:M12 family metallopeptidase [Terricaulis sp.]|uniref:M12 family metallopeptidase n=1 Tax=Terricaulis sp. TaxID=2768686 RepID=UPI002AC4A9BB|nr:M12 family metallopeptidase [Terricaulis sp.]MDZ4690033.1 M12 family metallopeptidase [Terricaulis sp.]
MSDADHTRSDGLTIGFAWVGRRLQQVRYTVEDGYAVADGCIILGRVEDIEALTEAARGASVKSVERRLSPPPYLWPNKTVAYEIDADVSSPERVTGAIAHWQSNTSLKFIRRTPTNRAAFPNYIRFVNQPGCRSAVGCQGGEQLLKLGASCDLGKVMHEIGHAVGLFHEHARSDRDQWVKIVVEKVDLRNRHVLEEKLSGGDEYGEYDYGSIMHYPVDAFTTDRSASIIPLKPTTARIGQRDGLSKRDIASVEHLYSAGLMPDDTA